MSVLVEFAMFPTDKGESVGAYVSRILKMMREEDVSYQLTAMGTIFETESMPEALHIIQKAYGVLAPDCHRVYATVTFDIRHGVSYRLEGKVASVKRHLEID